MQIVDSTALEAIQYQSNLLFKDLEQMAIRVTELSLEQFEKRQVQALEQDFANVLKHHFKCNVTFEIGDMSPSMRIFDEHVNNVLIRNSDRAKRSRADNFTARFIREYSEGRRSSVNIATGKLSGLFEELPFTIYMPIVSMWIAKKNDPQVLTPKEVAAIVLHEMGHFFTYCEYFVRTVSTNQVLASISKALDGSYSVERREVVIGEVKEKLKLSDMNTEALAAINDKHVIEIAIVSEAVLKSRSELGVNIYDNYSSEQLADQFATRFGAGRDLMTGLDKMEKSYGTSNAYKGLPSYMVSQLADILLCVIIPPFFILAVVNAFFEPHAYYHEEPEARTRRVRQDMVGQLKLPRLAADEKKRILQDIAVLDELLTKMDDKRDFFSVLIDSVIPVYRKYRQTMELQKQLETLAASSLFVRAAELTSL